MKDKKDKLISIREKIRKTEARQRKAEQDLKVLRGLEKKIEDDEILATIRSSVGKDGDVREALRIFQETQSVSAAKKAEEKEVEEHV